MLTLEQVQKDPYVLAFINHSNRTLDMQGFTEHGVRHARLVAERARMIAMKSATDNAKDLSQGLALEYNKARQSLITTEISDITTAQASLTK